VTHDVSGAGALVCQCLGRSTGPEPWIGLRENLQETMVFTIKYRGFLQIFPSSNSMIGAMDELVASP